MVDVEDNNKCKIVETCIEKSYIINNEWMSWLLK